MKGKKFLAGVLSAAMVLGTMALPVFADGETKGTENDPYTLDEFNALTDISGKDVWVNIDADISNQCVTIGNYSMSDEFVKVEGENPTVPEGFDSNYIRQYEQNGRTYTDYRTKKNAATVHVTGKLKGAEGTTESQKYFSGFNALSFQIPEASTVILEGMEISGIYNISGNYAYNYNMPDGRVAHTLPAEEKPSWATNMWYGFPCIVENITLNRCTITGNWLANGDIAREVKITNSKFNNHINNTQGSWSNPIWWKTQKSMTNFAIENSKIEACRPIKITEGQYAGNITITGNAFKMLDGSIATNDNTDSAKNAAIHLIDGKSIGDITISDNTIETADGVHTQLIAYGHNGKNVGISDSATVTINNNTKADGSNLSLKELINDSNPAEDSNWSENVLNFVNNYNIIADTLNLTFKKHTDDERVYDIVLNGNGKDINRLNAAEFVFDLSNADMTYEIKAADKLTTLQPDADKYVFYFDGKDAVNNADSGREITIGTVTFEGFGKFTFKATAGKATATTTADNLVNEFVTTTAAGKGTLEIGEDDNMIKDAEIKVPTQILTINVLMNHPVTAQTADYQDMTVAISGGDLAGKVLTYKLGDADTVIDDTTETVAMAANGSYEIAKKLTENRLYTVTVTGAGYRTARYTVTMNADKTLSVWNNVMSNEVTVVDDTKATTNFLAGDIVKDNSINIYDLSAVVAYFGQQNIDKTQASKFAKYDLNRDGEIDIMDISIVLTSWGK